jgi:hypothetical protein
VTNFEQSINYDDRITVADREKIISMLDEYSGTLRHRCDHVDRINKNRLSLTYFSLFSMWTILLLYIIINSKMYQGKNMENSPAIYSLMAYASFALTAFLLSMDSKTNFLRSMNRRNTRNTSEINSRTYEAHSLAHRLEKLVRIASSFHEHVEIRRINKIELDLKIAEAELVLNYYEAVVGQPKVAKGS